MIQKAEKKPITVRFTHILIQFSIIIFFVITWLNAPIFGVGSLNVWYFLFMFIGACLGGILTLYAKSNPVIPIPKKPTQQFTNLVKAITDIITNYIGKTTPAIQEIKDIIQKALVWSLREAEISPEFDQDTLTKAKDYIYKKLFPKTEEGEESSQNGEND